MRKSSVRPFPSACRKTTRPRRFGLRNKLLLYRFRKHGNKIVAAEFLDDTIEPRLNQIFAPLLSVVGGEDARAELRAVARELNAELIEDRGLDVEADILAVIQFLIERGDKPQVSIKDIATELQKRYGKEYDRNITSKWVGGIVRRRLQIKTQKSNGVYIIPLAQRPKLDRLFEKYGLTDRDTEADTAA